LSGYDPNILSELNITRNYILRMKRDSKVLLLRDEKVLLNSDGEDFCNYIKYKFPNFQLDGFLDKNVIILSLAHKNVGCTQNDKKDIVFVNEIHRLKMLSIMYKIKILCIKILRIFWYILNFVGVISLVVILIVLLILLILISFSDIFVYINFMDDNIENYIAGADVYDRGVGSGKDDLYDLDDGYSDP
jgi:hypothetical protein